MKKALLFLTLLLFAVPTFAQKKKTPAKKAVAEKAITLAKDETNNLEIQYLKNKISVYYTENGKKDTLFTRFTENPIVKENFTMAPLKIGTKNLYHFTWKEDVNKKTELITEKGSINVTEIWDLENKKNLLSNKQKNVDYEEIRYLSKHKDASETIAKKINEGRLCTLLANGDYTLSGKTGADKYVYNATDNEYKLSQPAKANTKKTTTPKRR